MNWELKKINGEFHTYPLMDIRQHFIKDCWCDPIIEDGIITHNSADQRELYEQGKRKPH